MVLSYLQTILFIIQKTLKTSFMFVSLKTVGFSFVYYSKLCTKGYLVLILVYLILVKEHRSEHTFQIILKSETEL